MRQSRLLVASLLVALSVSASVSSPKPAFAQVAPCSNGNYRTHGFYFGSTYTFWWNALTFPGYLGGNAGPALNAGPGGWNELRTECGRPGTSWSSYTYVGNNTFTPIKADGYNTIGWQDFGNPPPDGDSTCQGDMFANRFFYIGYACPFVDGSGREYEYGVALDAGDGWTTDLNNTSTNNVQVVSTHEYGHVSGLAHPDDGDCSSTAHNARLTMYRCLFPGSDQYTLGAGDMNGFLVKRP